MTEEIKDVKTDQTPSTDAAKDKVDTGKAESPKNDVYENIVGENKREIPYAVFKERNDKLRETERQLKQLGTEQQLVIDKAVKSRDREWRDYIQDKQVLDKKETDSYEEYEDDTSARQNEQKISKLEATIQDLKGGFSKLSQETETRELKRQITQLKDIYPSMDEEHVYAVKKMKPELSLDEAAQYSHEKFSTYTKALFDKMMDQKKEAAKAKVSGPEVIASLKPEDRPKTLEEAHDFVRKNLLGG